MNNDAMVAALGADAVAAVHGYRLQVIAEAERRGLRLVSEALCGVVRLAADVCLVVDPIDIRLTFGHVSRPGRPHRPKVDLGSPARLVPSRQPGTPSTPVLRRPAGRPATPGADRCGGPRLGNRPRRTSSRPAVPRSCRPAERSRAR